MTCSVKREGSDFCFVSFDGVAVPAGLGVTENDRSVTKSQGKNKTMERESHGCNLVVEVERSGPLIRDVSGPVKISKHLKTFCAKNEQGNFNWYLAA